jgi:histone demethylase JARID1
VNFAPPDWLRFGRVAAERYRLFRKSAVFSLEEMLCDAARYDLSPGMLQWVLPELEHTLHLERAGRERAAITGITRSRRLVSKVGLEVSNPETRIPSE